MIRMNSFRTFFKKEVQTPSSSVSSSPGTNYQSTLTGLLESALSPDSVAPEFIPHILEVIPEKVNVGSISEILPENILPDGNIPDTASPETILPDNIVPGSGPIEIALPAIELPDIVLSDFLPSDGTVDQLNHKLIELAAAHSAQKIKIRELESELGMCKISEHSLTMRLLESEQTAKAFKEGKEELFAAVVKLNDRIEAQNKTATESLSLRTKLPAVMRELRELEEEVTRLRSERFTIEIEKSKLTRYCDSLAVRDQERLDEIAALKSELLEQKAELLDNHSSFDDPHMTSERVFITTRNKIPFQNHDIIPEVDVMLSQSKRIEELKAELAEIKASALRLTDSLVESQDLADVYMKGKEELFSAVMNLNNRIEMQNKSSAESQKMLLNLPAAVTALRLLNDEASKLNENGTKSSTDIEKESLTQMIDSMKERDEQRLGELSTMRAEIEIKLSISLDDPATPDETSVEAKEGAVESVGDVAGGADGESVTLGNDSSITAFNDSEKISMDSALYCMPCSTDSADNKSGVIFIAPVEESVGDEAAVVSVIADSVATTANTESTEDAFEYPTSTDCPITKSLSEKTVSAFTTAAIETIVVSRTSSDESIAGTIASITRSAIMVTPSETPVASIAPAAVVVTESPVISLTGEGHVITIVEKSDDKVEKVIPDILIELSPESIDERKFRVNVKEIPNTYQDFVTSHMSNMATTRKKVQFAIPHYSESEKGHMIKIEKLESDLEDYRSSHISLTSSLQESEDIIQFHIDTKEELAMAVSELNEKIEAQATEAQNVWMKLPPVVTALQRLDDETLALRYERQQSERETKKLNKTIDTLKEEIETQAQDNRKLKFEYELQSHSLKDTKLNLEEVKNDLNKIQTAYSGLVVKLEEEEVRSDALKKSKEDLFLAVIELNNRIEMQQKATSDAEVVLLKLPAAVRALRRLDDENVQFRLNTESEKEGLTRKIEILEGSLKEIDEKRLKEVGYLKIELENKKKCVQDCELSLEKVTASTAAAMVSLVASFKESKYITNSNNVSMKMTSRNSNSPARFRNSRRRSWL